MVYDPVNERLLLFGGAVWENSYTFFNDLWSYDPSTYVWTKIEFGHGPSGRFNHMMTYIPERHQIFLFGGFSSSDRVGDTWVYDIEENEWIQLQPRDSPSPRSDAAIAYDEANMVVILFSGYCRDDSHPQDTWVYDFAENNWILMDPEESPKPQYGHYMIYDSLNQREVMYGGHWSIPSTGQHGYSDGVWTYDYPSDTWTKINPATRLPSRYWHTIAYDKDQSKMVVFGGSGGGDVTLDDTWFYDLSTNTWDRLTADVNPPKRENSALTYDPVNEKLILFGGLIGVGEPPLNDLWELDTAEGTWRQILPETSPPQEQSEASGQGNIPGFPLASITLALILIALSWQYIKKLDTFYHLND
jgi:N-acetylneuraminic acid mutarotase